MAIGSMSDIANALLEGIEYGIMVWNRRFERLSFRVRCGKAVESDHSEKCPIDFIDPAIPGIGAFYWISRNLPKQVDDLFFKTLRKLKQRM